MTYPTNEEIRHAEDRDDPEDEQTLVYVKEMQLLRKIVETSSDLILARHSEEFRNHCGGIEVLEKAHEKAYAEHHSWLSEFDTPFD